MIYNARRGFGDASATLTAAQAALAKAGYVNPQCEVQQVYVPGGTDYTQNVCSANGMPQGFDANLALQMTPAQLAAQLAYEQSSQPTNLVQSGPSYFDWSNAASGTKVLESTTTIKPPAQQVAQPGSTAASLITQAAKTTNATPSPNATPAGTSSSGSSMTSSSGNSNSTTTDVSSILSGTVSIGGMDIPYWLLGGGVILAFFMFKGK